MAGITAAIGLTTACCTANSTGTFIRYVQLSLLEHSTWEISHTFNSAVIYNRECRQSRYQNLHYLSDPFLNRIISAAAKLNLNFDQPCVIRSQRIIHFERGNDRCL